MNLFLSSYVTHHLIGLFLGEAAVEGVLDVVAQVLRVPQLTVLGAYLQQLLGSLLPNNRQQREQTMASVRT